MFPHLFLLSGESEFEPGCFSSHNDINLLTCKINGRGLGTHTKSTQDSVSMQIISGIRCIMAHFIFFFMAQFILMCLTAHSAGWSLLITVALNGLVLPVLRLLE